MNYEHQTTRPITKLVVILSSDTSTHSVWLEGLPYKKELTRTGGLVTLSGHSTSCPGKCYEQS